MSGLLMQFAYQWTDDNRDKLKEYTDEESLDKYLAKLPMVETFVTYAEKKGLKRRNIMIEKSRQLFRRYIHCRVIYNMLNEQALMQYLNKDDKAIQEALTLFEKGAAKPTMTEEKKE